MRRSVRASILGGIFFSAVALLERKKRLLVEHEANAAQLDFTQGL